MRTMEMIDFRNEYGRATSSVMGLKVGETLEIERKNKPTRRLKVEEIISSEERILSEDGERFLLDTKAHWERGTADIKLCPQGTMNLIGAIYKQAESEYEPLWVKGVENYWSEKLVGESRAEWEARMYREYTQKIKELEEFLGKVYTMYAKVRAVWRYLSHDPKVIAERTDLQVDHVVLIIDRLGLNRTETAQKDTIDD